MNGTSDPLLPFDGGFVGRKRTREAGRGSVLSTHDATDYWRNLNGISSPPSSQLLPDINRHDRSRVFITRYTGGTDATQVWLYEIKGGGHTEPSLTEHYRRLYKTIVGQQNRDIEMAEEVWKFFQSHH